MSHRSDKFSYINFWKVIIKRVKIIVSYKNCVSLYIWIVGRSISREGNFKWANCYGCCYGANYGWSKEISCHHGRADVKSWALRHLAEVLYFLATEILYNGKEVKKYGAKFLWELFFIRVCIFSSDHVWVTRATYLSLLYFPLIFMHKCTKVGEVWYLYVT